MNGREFILGLTRRIQASADKFRDDGDIKHLRAMVAESNRYDRWRKSKAGRSFLRQNEAGEWPPGLEKIIEDTKQQIRLEELGMLSDAIYYFYVAKKSELQLRGLADTVIAMAMMDLPRENVAEVIGGRHLPTLFRGTRVKKDLAEAESVRLRKILRNPEPQNQWTREEKSRVIRFAKRPDEELTDPEVVREMGEWKRAVMAEMKTLLAGMGYPLETGEE